MIEAMFTPQECFLDGCLFKNQALLELMTSFHTPMVYFLARRYLMTSLYFFKISNSNIYSDG